MDKIDTASIRQWLGTENQLNEAIEILKDIINGGYAVETFRNDVIEYFNDDDRGDINR